MTVCTLILFSSLFPLAAIGVGTGGVLIATVVAVAAFVGGAFIPGQENFRFLFLAQLPLCLVNLGVAWSLSQKLEEKTSGESDQKKKRFMDLKGRHAQLKAQVMQAELEENRSLQIYGLAKSLAQALSWKDMAPPLVGAIQKVFGVHEFLLYAIDANGVWSLLHRRGSWAQEPPVTGFVEELPRYLFPPVIREVVPVLAVPIALPGDGRNVLTGMMFLKCPSDKADDDLIAVAQQFGEQLGLALHKAMLFQQMEINSRMDGLTGVLRRQAFMDRLENELKRANAFHTPFCLLMIDIDHFKAVNDRHGHAAGDAVLSRVGQILKEAVYETDVVGRYGGEEFIVLLPHAQVDGVLRKAELLRQRFERDVIASGFEKLTITVSIGLAHFPVHGRNAEQLIGRADAAMYQAKQAGRNRVVAA